MSTYIFDETEDLGKVVKKYKVFCKLHKDMPIPEERYVVGDYKDSYNYPALAGRKWSRLCGFTFESLVQPGKIFQIVYVPKLKGSYSRNDRGLSGWYCWTIISKDNRQVTSISQMKHDFGFNVNKFFHCDLFDKYLKIFIDNVNYVISHQFEEMLSKPTDTYESYNELKRYIKAVDDSIDKIKEVKKFVSDDDVTSDDELPDYAKGSAPKVGHAKIAYNADKTYDLKNLDKKSQYEQMLRDALKELGLTSTPTKDAVKALKDKILNSEPK